MGPRTATAGVAGVVALLMAFWYSIFGGGSGIGTNGQQDPPEDPQQTSQKDEDEASRDEEKSKPSTPEEPEEKFDPSQPLEVTIRNRSYFINAEEVPLADVLEKAKQVSQDLGVQVNIYRTGTSRAKTEAELKQALVAAKISSQFIDKEDPE